jgi:hypothetical protein
LHEEVAYLAVALGWSRAEILSMTHRERARWVEQVNRIQIRGRRM